MHFPNLFRTRGLCYFGRTLAPDTRFPGGHLLKPCHLIAFCAACLAPHQVWAQDKSSQLTQLHDLLRVIKNDVKDVLPSLSHSDTVRLNHEVPCVRDFKKKAKAKSDLIATTDLVPHSQLQTGAWNEITSFDVGYGESAYVIPVGNVKWSGDAPPEHPLNHPDHPNKMRIEFARKIGDRIGPSIKYRGNVVRIRAPEDKVASLVWRVIDNPHYDNRNDSLKFAYFVYGGLGSMSGAPLLHPCDYNAPTRPKP